MAAAAGTTRVTLGPLGRRPSIYFVQGSSSSLQGLRDWVIQDMLLHRNIALMTQHTLPILKIDTVFDQFPGNASFQSIVLLFTVFPACALHVCMCIQCLACQGNVFARRILAASNLSSSHCELALTVGLGTSQCLLEC